jgi:hypothetical protein
MNPQKVAKEDGTVKSSRCKLSEAKSRLRERASSDEPFGPERLDLSSSTGLTVEGPRINSLRNEAYIEVRRNDLPC